MSAQPMTIVTISQSLLRVGTVIASDQPVQNLVEYDWNRDTLAEILTQIKASHQTQSIRVILSEAFSYVLCLPSLIPNQMERAAVEERLQNLIPEILSRVVWDYKETGLHLNPLNGASEAIQVIAVDRSFLDDLSSAVQAAELTVEAMEPISVSLARQTQGSENPHAILYVGQVPLRLIAHKGLVLTSQIMGTQLLGNHLGELFRYTQTHFGLTPNHILLAGDTAKIDQAQLQTLPIPTQVQNLDPMIGMSLKTDLDGKDEWILNLSPLTKEFLETQVTEIPATAATETPGQPIQASFGADSGEPAASTTTPHQNALNVLFHPESQADPSPEPARSKLGIRFLSLGITLGTAALIVGGFFGWQWYSSPTTVSPTPSPMSTIAATATPSATLVPKANLKIQVLNGSGQAGAASKMATFLKDLGYESIDTGNAKTYDYQATEIQVKAGEAKLYKELQDALAKDFTIAKEPGILPASSEYHVVVIVGEE